MCKVKRNIAAFATGNKTESKKGKQVNSCMCLHFIASISEKEEPDRSIGLVSKIHLVFCVSQSTFNGALSSSLVVLFLRLCDPVLSKKQKRF